MDDFECAPLSLNIASHRPHSRAALRCAALKCRFEVPRKFRRIIPISPAHRLRRGAAHCRRCCRTYLRGENSPRGASGPKFDSAAQSGSAFARMHPKSAAANRPAPHAPAQTLGTATSARSKTGIRRKNLHSGSLDIDHPHRSSRRAPTTPCTTRGCRGHLPDTPRSPRGARAPSAPLHGQRTLKGRFCPNILDFLIECHKREGQKPWKFIPGTQRPTTLHTAPPLQK